MPGYTPVPTAFAGSIWTPEERERLRRLRDEGMSREAIGTLMGRSTDAIRKAVARLDKPQKSQAEIAPKRTAYGISQRIRLILADGEWHPIREIVGTVADMVAPNTALKRFIRNNHNTPQSQSEQVRRGRISCVTDALRRLPVEQRGPRVRPLERQVRMIGRKDPDPASLPVVPAVYYDVQFTELS